MTRRFTYSNLVAFLKVMLPLAALALLATLFLVPQDVDLEGAIPFADVELEQRLRDQQITAPSFSAQTPRGHIVTVNASAAHPDAEDPSRTVASELVARIEMQGGRVLTVEAANGEMDSTFDELTLENGVRVTSSSGIDLKTDTMTMSVQEARAESEGEVVATTDFGTLQAGRMAIRPASDGDDIYLFFTKGVRLLYTPKVTSKEP